jgi:hypothetical protein
MLTVVKVLSINEIAHMLIHDEKFSFPPYFFQQYDTSWMNITLIFTLIRSIGNRLQGAIDCQRKKRSEADHGGECNEEIRA